MANDARDDSKTTVISVRLAPDEESTLRSAATAHGESLSQFIRSAVLERCSLRVGNLSDYQTTVTTSGDLAFVTSEDGRSLLPKTSGGPYVVMH